MLKSLHVIQLTERTGKNALIQAENVGEMVIGNTHSKNLNTCMLPVRCMITVYLFIFCTTYVFLTVPSWIHRVALTDQPNLTELVLDFDICGVKYGDESSCLDLLKSIGIQRGTKNWKLRDMLLRYINVHNKIMDPKDNSVPKR